MWTPGQLRARTLAANNGFVNQKAADEAAELERRFQECLKLFERGAAEAADKGQHEAIACEYEGSAELFADIDAKSKALFERVRLHFEAMGYKTRIKGPFTAGRMMSPCTGFDLYAQWLP